MVKDKYDRELYIPKGYILPDGTQLTKKYARLHEDMAKKFIEENYYTSYQNDFIKEYKDYMLMRLHALQVLSCGKPIISYCDDQVNKVITDAISSYLSYGWDENIIFNPTASYFDYLEYYLLKENGAILLLGEKEYEKKIIK